MPKSLPVRIVLHFLNARPAENWQRVVDAPFRANLPPPPTPDGPVLGVESLDQLNDALTGFRELTLRLSELGGAERVRRRILLTELFGRAPLQVKDYGFDQRTRRLELRLDMGFRKDLTSILYGNLALALMETRVLRCEFCQGFFADHSQRQVKYCSPKCRNQVAVLRYRERHPERYREYQRKLMRIRSRVGTGRDGDQALPH